MGSRGAARELDEDRRSEDGGSEEGEGEQPEDEGGSKNEEDEGRCGVS